MTKISRKKLEPNTDEYLRDQLWKAVTLLEDKTQVKEFLRDILTRTEITMLSKRLQAVKMIDEGYTYRQISKGLNMSESTIGKLHNWFDAFGSGYRNVIERLQKIENQKDGFPKKYITPASSRAALGIWVGAGKATVQVYKKYKKRKSAKS